MASTIQITFNNTPPINGYVTIFNPQYLGVSGFLYFKPQRTQSQEFDAIGSITPEVNQIAQNFANAFILDYNASGVFNVSVAGAIVTIETQENNVFDGFSSVMGAGTISKNITNTANPVPINIQGLEFLAPDSNPCTQVKVRVTTENEFDSLTALSPSLDVSYDPKVTQADVNINRETTFLLFLENTDTNQTTSTAALRSINTTPLRLLPSSLNLSHTTNPTGANLTARYNAPLGMFNMEYSLDGINWNTSGVFSGLVSDTYLVRARDQYGCVISKSYVIGDVTAGQSSVPPLFYYPKSNPISFIPTREIEPSENLNFEDVIACSPFMNHTKWLEVDKPTVQFRSTRTYHKLRLVDEDGNTVQDDFTFNQQTENINRFDSRDARLTVGTNGDVSIYFTTGQTYDINGDAITDGEHHLNGSFPNHYRVGLFVIINGVTQVITAKSYNNDLSRWEFKTSYNDFDAPDTAIVSSYYHEQPYEIFEVLFDMDGLNGFYQFEMDYGTSETDIEDTWYSEIFEVTDSFEDNDLLTYASDVNNDIIYNTGYYGRLRLERVTSAIFVPTREIDNFQNDNKLVQLDNRSFHQFEFEWSGLSLSNAQKLDLIFLNNIIFINGLEYTPTAAPELNPINIDKSNPALNRYSFKITLQRQEVHSFISEAYNPQAINNGGNFTFGTYINSGGQLIDSNGFVVNNSI